MGGVIAQLASLAAPCLVFPPDFPLVPDAVRQKYAQGQMEAAQVRGALRVSVGDALALVEPAPFDSQCLGMSMVKVSWFCAESRDQEKLAQAVLAKVKSSGFDHVMIRTDAGNLAFMQALERNGFYLADTSTKLLCAAGSFVSCPLPAGCSVDKYRPGDLPQIQEISADIFRRSRFYADPSFPKARVDELHRLWVRNDCEGRADLVLVCRREEKVLGYIACLFTEARDEFGLPSEADIDLVAVSPQAQGQGIGKALVGVALQHYRERATRITVGTQGSNYPALALYAQCGFR
ncbi:MAG TPA: GNAT family N-acetyltransferase, partial [Terriglobales bacterium]